MKKLFSLSLALVFLCMSAARAGSVPLVEIIEAAREGEKPADTAKVSHTAMVYLGTLLSPEELKVWHVSSWEDVPFVSVTDYLELCLALAEVNDYSLRPHMLLNNRITLKCGDGSAVFDAGSNTVSLSDPEEFMGYMNLAGASPTSVMQFSEGHDSTYDPGEDLVISLDDYGLKMIPVGKDILIPFQAAEVMFGQNMTGYAFIYNGQDFYDVSYLSDDNSYAYGSVNPSPYQDALYSGPFAERENLTPSYSRYYLGTLSMMMDLLHGRSSETGYTSMMEYIKNVGLEPLLLSLDAGDIRSGVDRLLNIYFDTSHDGYTGDSGVFDTGATLLFIRDCHEEDLDLAASALRSGAVFPAGMEEEEEEDEKWDGVLRDDRDVETLTRWVLGDDYSRWLGPANQQMMKWTCLMDWLCPEEIAENSLQIHGDTAIITFDSFRSDDSVSSFYYLALPTEDDWEYDTFGFFYSCFEIISRTPEVRRVVFDLSNNGGGDAQSLCQLLGFLTPDGDVNITYMNTYTGAYNSDWMHVDTNLDGVMDDRDGWGGQYEFYIVTSPSTYSCGNAFAFYAAKQDLAKVIGRQPGGGDCVINLWYDAIGLVSSYSGNLKLGIDENGRFVSSEGTVPMTAEWGSGTFALDAPWYSPEGIVDFIDRLEAGEMDDAA
ncbi:MAG: hypothetical protein IKP22_04775 [Clostridia bacterium]|nr:hypothetical protein [Clostridia bacterium]